MLPAPEAPPADLRLDNWTQWLEARNPARIELGLDRPRRVLERLGLPPRNGPLITVAGTNGKGSVVATLDALAGSAGLRAGAYLSPHIHRFNERIRIGGQDVDDADLVQAFRAVAAAEGDDQLSYFEFTTLAAFWLFAREALDLWVLEVGLGGRLDAVNLLDADVAIISSVGLDHTDWLGESLDDIAAEKAGILRRGRPVLLGRTAARPVVRQAARTLEAPVLALGEQLTLAAQGRQWSLQGPALDVQQLPMPRLQGDVQLDNAALALAAWSAAGLPLTPALASDALLQVRLPGRCQVLRERPRVVLDTAHNREAAAALAQALDGLRTPGRTIAVLGMLAGKPVSAVVQAMDAQVAHWHCCGLPGPRGLTAEALAADLAELAGIRSARFPTVEAGLQAALDQAGPDDRIVVLGSFHTVEAALTLLADTGDPTPP